MSKPLFFKWKFNALLMISIFRSSWHLNNSIFYRIFQFHSLRLFICRPVGRFIWSEMWNKNLRSTFYVCRLCDTFIALLSIAFKNCIESIDWCGAQPDEAHYLLRCANGKEIKVVFSPFLRFGHAAMSHLFNGRARCLYRLKYSTSHWLSSCHVVTIKGYWIGFLRWHMVIQYSFFCCYSHFAEKKTTRIGDCIGVSLATVVRSHLHKYGHNEKSHNN